MEYWIIGDEFLDEEPKKEADAQGYLKELVRCKDCRYFETDHWEKVNETPLIVAHEICTRWGEGCKTTKDGYCFMAERARKMTLDEAVESYVRCFGVADRGEKNDSW